MTRKEFDALKPGDRVHILRGHPWAGNDAVVVRRGQWMDEAILVVALKRNDAMDGHEAGVQEPRHLRRTV